METNNNFLMTLVITLGSVLTGVITALGVLLVNYRKAADAGNLAAMQVDLQQVKEGAAAAKTKAEEAEKRAVAIAAHVQECIEDRAELRGQLAASKEDRQRLNGLLNQVIQESGRQAGRMAVIEGAVARDTSETVKLAEKHGQNEARLVKLENGGGAKPHDCP